ncbi:methyltransferase domain-containing protein [Treponema pedis]|uniref:methyltransferase domain-containing protein n=1 Tax=Treponema pedis TaxID=409322 RepID=UPI000464ABE7|nr:methyltransferase domain-containing protein [Treponema pedis]
MGTGEGEFIDSFEKLLPQMYATEGYAPNIEIAKNRLSKRGVTVKVIADDNKLPFKENTFDLMVNKHESYSVLELSRIMKPNGQNRKKA